MSERWWHQAVGYEVYVSSFADADGDGLGDLTGIRRRLDHLHELGVDLVWLTPFYPSPLADHGYDVADYTGVDPRFGSLEDLRALVTAIHGLGMRVIIDLVPNHSSDQHPWFRAAVDEPGGPYRDYYVWRDPAPDGGPPNNWVSHFGGPAWTLDAASGQYYMHLFLPEQPDLNWANPAVQAEFDRILRFWLDEGVDGFRIDVAHSLLEDPQFRDNPYVGAVPAEGAGPREVFRAFDHVHDLDQPDVLSIYQRWRRLTDEYDALLLGEVYLHGADRVARYVTGDDGLHLAFYFPTLFSSWNADDVRGRLREGVEAAGHRLALPMSSHDDPYAAHRFGGGERGRDRVVAYLTLLAGLPGVPFLYQGDELGLENAELDTVADPIATRNPGAVGRDGTRAPMPWSTQAGWGFTQAPAPWLPFGSNRRPADTVAVQREDPSSTLRRVQGLLALRRAEPIAPTVPTRWVTDAGPVVAYRRGDRLVATNLGEHDATVDAPGPWRVRYRSRCGPTDEVVDTLVLGPDEAVWATAADSPAGAA